ncbi:MAG: zinc-dependent metalloprotease [Phycisphaerales bacterium]|nr:zinc-dependent metalloprotease [Planctomycetota bacterium]MCH8509742.1 zinc-dependent metalloprotease [Phycisphaerales bacterium]
MRADVWAMMGVLAVPALVVAGQDQFAPFEKVIEGYERVSVPTGQAEMYTIYQRERDAQLLAELPRDFEGKRFYVVATVAGGHPQAGVYSIWHSAVRVPTKTVYWSRRGDQLALIEPNLSVRSSGDAQSRAGVERVNTDRVVLSVPILAIGPGGGPVIDLDRALLGSSQEFVGGFLRGSNASLARITRVKVFPRNVEVGFELPRAGGQLAEVRFSLGMPEKAPNFKPRIADRRVGIYYESFQDRAINDGTSQTVRYANRWHIEKADPRLSMSPPKEPIVFHIEHTTPLRYRRWVREGVLAWNKAFERVGIIDAIEVRQQDASSGAFMDIDPEDIRYSFVRWTNAGMGFAIGPVHVHPDTGQIYESVIVMDEGFIGSYANQYLQSELAATAMSVISPELSSWLAEHPGWDPRVILAEPGDQARVRALTRALAERPDRAPELLVGAPPTMSPAVWEGHRMDNPAWHRMCLMQPGLSSGVSAARLAMDLGIGALGLANKPENKDDASLLDGLPEWFVGPLLRDVVMHEVGHALGLTHNWKGASLHSIAEINSEGFNKPIQSTVMDYAATNIIVEDPERGLVQGDYVPMDIGPYDMWAIEWNYTFGDPDEVASRAAMPEHAFMAEDGQFSPDPTAKTWVLGRDTLDFAEERIRFVDKARSELLDRAVKDGESWEKARRVYQQLLGMQFGAVNTAMHWIGGAHIHRSMKGDPDAPPPLRPVEAAQQRRALAFIIDHAFDSASYGLDPEVLAYLQSDNWYDEGYGTPHAWPVAQSVLGVQASAITGLINPQRLSWVMDNELRTPEGEDALTVPEIFDALREKIWALPDPDGTYTNRDPLVGQLERNLQMEYLTRMINLATGMRWPGANGRTIQALARQELAALQAKVLIYSKARGIDAYSSAHLRDANERITRALEAAYLRTE